MGMAAPGPSDRPLGGEIGRYLRTSGESNRLRPDESTDARIPHYSDNTAGR